MKVLALESSTKIVTIALVSQSDRMAQASSEAGQSGSAVMTPMLGKLLHDTNTTFADIELIAISIGPGSFTGLRIGVVAAKSLAYAHKIPVASVNTLQVIAQAAAEDAMATENAEALEPWVVCPAVNAQRGQLFVGQFSVARDGDELVTESVRPMSIVDRDQWLQQVSEIAASGKRPLLTGAGIKPILNQIETLGLRFTDEQSWQPRACLVAKIGQEQFEAGDREDFLKIEPLYFRPSAAEEKRLAKLAANQE